MYYQLGLCAVHSRERNFPNSHNPSQVVQLHDDEPLENSMNFRLKLRQKRPWFILLLIKRVGKAVTTTTSNIVSAVLVGNTTRINDNRTNFDVFV